MVRHSRFNRRGFLAGGSAAAAAAAFRPRYGFSQTPMSSPAAAPVASPVGSVDADGVYRSGEIAVPDAYVKFPEPFKATDGPPGSGGEVTTFQLTYSAPPAQHGDNAYWQGLEERLNVSWRPSLTPNASYGEKATTLIASGDMPDLFYINTIITNVPLKKYIQEGAFNDLSEYLTGDALQEYPNLAVFPDYMWEACKTDGLLYGVPCPTNKTGQLPMFRTDWAETILGHDPTNADEAHDFFVRVKDEDPDGNGANDTYGMNIYGTYWSMGLLQNMFRLPPSYKVEDGQLIPSHTLPEFKQYLEFTQKLYADGGYHPDAVGMSWDNAVAEFTAGHTSIHTDGSDLYGPNGFLARIQQNQPDARVARLIPPGHDGGEGVTYNGTGIFGFSAIPATITDGDRIRELLRILDWMSAPYGSEENTYKENGEEGVHFNFNEHGFPIRTPQMDKEEGQLTGYMGGRMPVNVNPLQPEIGPLITDEQNAAYAIGLDNPVANLFSPTDVDEGGLLWQIVDDEISNFITGRGDMEAVDRAVQRWLDEGGSQIQQEYQEAYDAANAG